MMNTRSLVALLVSVGLCLLAGASAGWITATSVESWYTQIRKPAWTPPSALFAPVWTTLYVMMGVSAWIVWRSDDASRRTALALFGLQLLLNAAWSFIFFGLRSPGWAVIEIALLWLILLVTIVSFVRISRPAAWLLVPYLLWVSFAAALNYSVWSLNS